MTGGSAFHLTASSQVAGSGGGILHSVSVNTGASGATLTLYDSTAASGAVIAVIAATASFCLTYDTVLNAGLYAVVSGSIDVTVTILPNDQYAP